jgi:hypothetical protein
MNCGNILHRAYLRKCSGCQAPFFRTSSSSHVHKKAALVDRLHVPAPRFPTHPLPWPLPFLLDAVSARPRQFVRSNARQNAVVPLIIRADWSSSPAWKPSTYGASPDWRWHRGCRPGRSETARGAYSKCHSAKIRYFRGRSAVAKSKTRSSYVKLYTCTALCYHAAWLHFNPPGNFFPAFGSVTGFSTTRSLLLNIRAFRVIALW